MKVEKPQKNNLSEQNISALRYYFVNYFDRAHVTPIKIIPQKVIGIQQ